METHSEPSDDNQINSSALLFTELSDKVSLYVKNQKSQWQRGGGFSAEMHKPLKGYYRLPEKWSISSSISSMAYLQKVTKLNPHILSFNN